MRTLYVSWDGPGPNYLESLFMPIFDELQKKNVTKFLLRQYAWDAELRSASIAEAATALEMPYRVRDVGRGSQTFVTGAMMIAGGFDIARVACRDQVDVLMPRSVIPAAMCLVALRFLPRVKLLYDADGLKADERADFGGWRRSGKMYRLFSWIEQATVARADVVVTRTKQCRKILAERARDEPKVMAKTFVTSNGKNSRLFSPGTAEYRTQVRDSLGVPSNAPLVVYAGSLGTQYFPERMIAFFEMLQHERSDACLLMLTGTPEVATKLIEKARVLKGRCFVRSVHPSQVPKLIGTADLGLAFRASCLSQQAVAPIKVGEYLLCGVPVFSSTGIGDLDSQLDGSVGMLANELSNDSLEMAVRWLVDRVLMERESYRERCRNAGIEHFSLGNTITQYQAAFQQLEISKLDK